MIDCHIIENNGLVAVIEIEGADFWDSLKSFKYLTDREDREYDEENKVWLLRNPEKYASSIRAVRNALNTHKKQRRMF